MARIVIYDSGVGGLTIYQRLVQRLAKAVDQHSLVFVSDNEAYPYGTKTESQLLKRISQLADSITQTYNPDILVVACNTASTLALDSLRARLSCEVVGVVPAIKPAALLSETNTIGLLATPATIKRDYTNDLIATFAKHCTVVKVGSSDLVEAAEAKLSGQQLDSALLAQVLQPFIKCEEMDVLVLACTHFPILANEISAAFKSNNRSVSVIDSGEAIAKRIINLSKRAAIESHPHPSIASFTEILKKDNNLIVGLKEIGFLDVHHLKIKQNEM